MSIHQATSIDPVEVESMQITKSVSGERKDASTRSIDIMGTKHFVRFGLYEIKGSINVQLTQKTGFSEEDTQIVKKCLASLFVNDASSARPDGSMEVVKLYWFKHNCKDGVVVPSEVGDYDITVNELPDLSCEEVDCL